VLSACGVAVCHIERDEIPFDRGGKISNIRTKVSETVRKYLPSPNSELLLGTTLGIDELYQTPRFNDVLISTGTIHVVVVSGYNISLVFHRFIKLLKSFKSLLKIIAAQILVVIYALITGFEPPVVRGLIMVSLVIWGSYLGHRVRMLRVLVLSGLVMIAANPAYLYSLSFQLSLLATFGIVALADSMEEKLVKLFGNNILVSDLAATLSAQLLVTPLLIYTFGRVSLASPIINALILWIIPHLTILGAILVLGASLHVLSGRFLAFIYKPFSDIFINIVFFGGQLQ
jgi:competence protein ComEC